MKHLRDIPPMAMLAAVPVVFALALASCEPDPAGAAPPPPAPASFGLEPIVQADTFTIVATWPPVVFSGDTVRTYRRSLVRTDTAGTVFGGEIAAVGSETLEMPSPAPGETGAYRYCLRSVNSFGVSQDSTCAAFQYTNPDTLPPPPDSVTVDPQQTVTADSVDVVPDSLRMVFDVDASGDTVWLYTLAWHKGVKVDSVPGNSYPLRAEVYNDGVLIGCAGACDGVVLEPATWENGVPVVLRGRPGYNPGSEWMATRLPWLRELAAG